VIEPSRVQVNVSRLAAGVLDEVNTEGHPIHVGTSGPVYAYVDPGHVERVVENLVTNAIRYTPDGTPIWVRVEDTDEGLLIRVEDAGPGVPAALRDTIFEPFRQGTEQVQHSPGVGIGLSLVARFAQLHGGRAWCSEREGGGASFSVLFPHATPKGDRAGDEPATSVSGSTVRSGRDGAALAETVVTPGLG
jgi:signal transduction histidine kinase